MRLPDLSPAEWTILSRLRRNDMVASWSNPRLVKLVQLRLVMEHPLILPNGRLSPSKRWSIDDAGIVALDVRAAEAERRALDGER